MQDVGSPMAAIRKQKNKLNLKSSDIHHRTSDKSTKNFKQIKWHKIT